MTQRILLIDPHFTEGLKGFPLGLSYIAGALLQGGYDVRALDLTAKSIVERVDYHDALRDELASFEPEIVGITSSSPTHMHALEAARIVKEWRDVPVIKGGPHESHSAKTTIANNPEIDYSVAGEGERTILKLIDALVSGKGASGIQGVVYRDGERVVDNGRRGFIENLDELALPARQLFYLNEAYDEYYSAGIFGGRKSTTVATSRGCPYACSFCSSSANWGGIRQRTADSVVGELALLRSLGFFAFMFEDDMSIANKGWFLEFSSRLRHEVLGIEYSLQTRVDAVDDDVAVALHESGCRFMYFGIESGVQEILDSCNKGITIGQARDAFSILRTHGIHSMASIQFGLPGEDLEGYSTVRETIRVLNDVLKPDEVAVSYTCLYPGSPLAIQEGITPEMYEHYMRTRADEAIYNKTAHGSYAIHPKKLTDERMMEIEEIVASELRIKRFDVKDFYNA